MWDTIILILDILTIVFGVASVIIALVRPPKTNQSRTVQIVVSVILIIYGVYSLIKGR
ncbi:MAG: hypothetical protein MSH49_03100 [[Eubacterium] saphenum]|nr:hypothetical protein [[Eubacterium] saphenum]